MKQPATRSVPPANPRELLWAQQLKREHACLQQQLDSLREAVSALETRHSDLAEQSCSAQDAQEIRAACQQQHHDGTAELQQRLESLDGDLREKILAEETAHRASLKEAVVLMNGRFAALERDNSLLKDQLVKANQVAQRTSKESRAASPVSDDRIRALIDRAISEALGRLQPVTVASMTSAAPSIEQAVAPSHQHIENIRKETRRAEGRPEHGSLTTEAYDSRIRQTIDSTNGSKQNDSVGTQSRHRATSYQAFVATFSQASTTDDADPKLSIRTRRSEAEPRTGVSTSQYRHMEVGVQSESPVARSPLVKKEPSPQVHISEIPITSTRRPNSRSQLLATTFPKDISPSYLHGTRETLHRQTNLKNSDEQKEQPHTLNVRGPGTHSAEEAYAVESQRRDEPTSPLKSNARIPAFDNANSRKSWSQPITRLAKRKMGALWERPQDGRIAAGTNDKRRRVNHMTVEEYTAGPTRQQNLNHTRLRTTNACR